MGTGLTFDMKYEWKKIDPRNEIAMLHHMLHMFGDIGVMHKMDPLPLAASKAKLIAERIDFLEAQVKYYKDALENKR